MPDLTAKHIVGCAGLIGATGLYLSAKSDIPRETIRDTYTDEQSDFVSLRGMDVHYRDTGSGPALVLLHGTASSLHTWNDWCDRLTESFRVIRMDLPGFGVTGPEPNGRYGLYDYVNFLEAFRQRLELDSFHVAGNSFGGKIAWTYAANNPASVEKLVLIDSMGFMDRWPSLFALPTIPVFGHATKTFTPYWLIRYFIRSLYGDPERLTQETLDRYFELLLASGNRRALHRRLNEPITRNQKQLGQVRSPTLVQWGTHDPILPVSQTRMFDRRLENGSVITYLGAGHAPMEEIPEQTAHDAERFIRD